MSFNEHDSVVLLRDVPSAGLCAGDLGAIVHMYEGDALEVEFVRLTGATQAVVTLASSDVRPVGGTDVLAVRPTKAPPP